MTVFYPRRQGQLYRSVHEVEGITADYIDDPDGEWCWNDLPPGEIVVDLGLEVPDYKDRLCLTSKGFLLLDPNDFDENLIRIKDEKNTAKRKKR